MAVLLDGKTTLYTHDDAGLSYEANLHVFMFSVIATSKPRLIVTSFKHTSFIFAAALRRLGSWKARQGNAGA